MISLITVMGAGLFALAAVLSIATGTIGEIVKNHQMILGDLTFHAAEANLREGTHQYINDQSYTGGTAALLNNADTASIAVTDLGWPYAKAQGSAANNGNNRKVARIITVFPEGLAFDYAVYAQNDLIMGGNLKVNGDIFANDGIDFNGVSAEINGDAYSPLDVEDNGNVNGNIIEGVDSIPPPTLDAANYEAAAIADGTYFDDDSDAEDYVNGNVVDAAVFVRDSTGDKSNIGGNNTNLFGSLIVDGDLDLTGGLFTASDNYAAIVVYGDLKIAGGTTINGIVYVSGSITFGGGNNTINGSLISVGGASVTDLTGNATINFDPNVYAAWTDIEGLVTASSEDPRPLEWLEE